MNGEISDSSQTVAAGELRSIIERVERLHEERKALAEDIKDIFAEAKGRGYDAKAIKFIIKRRAMSKAERDEFDGIVELYEAALGML